MTTSHITLRRETACILEKHNQRDKARLLDNMVGTFDNLKQMGHSQHQSTGGGSSQAPVVPLKVMSGQQVAKWKAKSSLLF
jgi:hypothetical protein